MEPSLLDHPLLEHLSKVQQELKVPKSQRNSFGNYNYRNCEDILEAVKPLLTKYGLVLTLSDELVRVGERYYIKAEATVRFIIAKSGTRPAYTSTGWAREEETKKGMDGSQITGASSSYARKYALNGLFLIDDTKDSDTTNDGKKSNTIKAASRERARVLLAQYTKAGQSATDVIRAILGKDVPETEYDMQQLIASLDDLPERP